MKKCLLPLVFLCSSVISYADSVTTRSIDVEAQAKVAVTPDQVHIEFTISKILETSSQAKNEVDRISRLVMNTLKSYDIKLENISAEKISVQIRKEYDHKSKTHKFMGVEVKRHFNVLVENTKSYPELIDKILDHGVNDFGRVNFRASNLEVLQNQALVKAIEKGKAKAKLMSQQLDAKVGKIIHIGQSSIGPSPKPMTRASLMSSESSPIFAPGQLDVVQNVFLRFELID